MKKRVRAIIITTDSILLMHRVKPDREYWVFPGGGLEETDSSPQEGLKRECMEELGVEVAVGNLFAEERLDSPQGEQAEYFYRCRIVSGEVGTGEGPEFSRDPMKSGTYDPQWIPIRSLPGKNVQPTTVRDKLISAY